MKPSDFLTEAAAPKVGRKYQHIEDLVLSDGSHGGLHAVERLKHMGEEGGSIELKWDGMPVVYWGRDEAGNFSMIPKNAWAYLKSGKTETSSGAPTVMRSPKDIQAFVLGTGSGDPKARQQFANQFASLWPYFEKISPKQGYLEGGLLFYPGTKPDGTSAMPGLNSETNTYDFTPNITTFHIPVDSELGKKIAKSKVMVAATGYYPTMGSSDEQRFPDAERLSVPGVIVQGTTYVQEPVALDSQGLDSMEAFIKQNAKLIDNYLAPKPGLSNPGGELYTYLNKHLRTEGLLADFPEWARANLSAKKAETLLSDTDGLKATLGAVEGLGKQKNVLINQLSQGLHGGIKQTKPEGYAQAHPGKQFSYDLPGQFIKAIDQTNWSPKASTVNEAKSGQKAVVGWGRGMGHTGHDALVKAVIHQAESTGATPYFVVSRSFGKDDPIPPETKVKMYQKKFPEYANMFSLPTAEAPTLNHVLADLATKGVTDVTLVVGADQKEAFGYLTRPDKSGVPPYKNFGLNSLTIMSRQDTKEPSSDVSSPDYHEGPRATPMREVLLDPNKTEQEQFAVWRQAMSPALDDKEVLDMMNTAKQNLVQFHTKKPRRKASDIKEHIAKMRPLLKEATVEQQYKMLKLMKEAYETQVDEYSVRNTKKFIQRAHDIEQGQSYGSQPYSSHPKAVANIGKKFFGTQFTPEAVKVALLHDVLEDTPYTPQQLAQKGFSKEVIQAVQLLTKDKNLSYADNIKNIINSGNKLAMMVKYSDNYMNYTSDKSHWESERANHSNKKYLASLNMLGDVLGIKKHLGDEESVAEGQTADMRAFFAGTDSNKPVPNVRKTIVPEEIKMLMSMMMRHGERSLSVAQLEKLRNYKLGKKLYASESSIEEDKESDPVIDAAIKFYSPVMQKVQKEKVENYVEKAKYLLQKTDDPKIRKKLIGIFQEGKHSPYLQGGIITAIAALLGGGAINIANNIHLTPYQTNLMMQGILNSIVPAVGARMSGKNWKDTLKYTLASLGVGIGIATVMEDDDYLDEK